MDKLYMAITKLLFCLCIFILFIGYYIIQRFYYEPSVYVKSPVNNKYYEVLDLKDKQHVADTIAFIMDNMERLMNYMYKSDITGEYSQYLDRLKKRLPSLVVMENIVDPYFAKNLTSYTVNKGDKMVLCARSRIANKIHDVNLITYVVLHEMAHVACPEYGHTDTFKKIFKFMTKSAIDAGIYKRINFSANPTEYCGMTIDDSIV